MKFHIFLVLFLLWAIRGYSQSPDSINQLINNYHYHDALSQLDQMHPDSMDMRSLYLKSVALKALSRYSEAIVCLDSMYRSDSSDTKIAIELADCYKSINNVAKPEAIYLKALSYRSDNFYIMQLLANLYMTTEKYQNAKIWYLKACEKDTSEFILKQIGYCYDKLSMDDSAVYYYTKAIDYDRDDYQPVFRLGNLYKDKRMYDNALAVTDTFLSYHPDNRDVTRLSGYVHYLNQKFRKAIARFEHSYELSDSSAFVNKYLGYSYFKLNDFQHAIRYMEKVYAMDSSDAELCYALGLAHDVPENIRYFNAAIHLGSPAIKVVAQVYVDLSLALTKAWRYDEALEALMLASELLPRDISITYKIAVHYDNWMDNKPFALKYYKDLLASRTDTTDSYFITETGVLNQTDYKHAEKRISDIESSLNAPMVASDSIMLNMPEMPVDRQ